MKNFIILLGAFFIAGCTSPNKKAVLHISFDNIKTPYCWVRMANEISHSSGEISVKSGKVTERSFDISHPFFVSLRCYDGSKFFCYTLYLSPGDDLELKADFNKPGYNITVSGKGSNNNQPLMGLTKQSSDLASFNKDTLPDRVINTLNAEQRVYESNLKKYIARYKPSEDYVTAWKTDLPYLITYNYYTFKEDNKFGIGDGYKRNYARWQKVADSLFSLSKISNDEALNSIHYTELIGDFLPRERERLLNMAQDEPQSFYKEWYNADTLNGEKLLMDDTRNLLQEKIINKYFSGKSAEYAYAILLKDAAREADPQNIPQIFERFKNKYPHSDYIALFRPSVDTISARFKQVLNSKMTFLADNGVRFNTLQDVIAAMKGKTVLVDMWGTWCGPCREEIEKHSSSIREHFKGKNLNYLYIANYDLKNGEQWKKLIAYFNIEGTHMLANEKLTGDILAKVKGQGFPTMFVIRKDGTIEQAKSQYPINEEVLISQLEAALKE
jgi:thiol-disulfide isomerase/thioredoxin